MTINCPPDTLSPHAHLAYRPSARVSKGILHTKSHISLFSIFKQLTSFKIIELNRISIFFHETFRINVELNFSTLSFVYKIPYRRARAWPSGCISRVRARAKVSCILVYKIPYRRARAWPSGARAKVSCIQLAYNLKWNFELGL